MAGKLRIPTDENAITGILIAKRGSTEMEETQTRANENARYSVLTSRHSELASEPPSCIQVPIDAESSAEHAGNLTSGKGFQRILKNPLKVRK